MAQVAEQSQQLTRAQMTASFLRDHVRSLEQILVREQDTETGLKASLRDALADKTKLGIQLHQEQETVRRLQSEMAGLALRLDGLQHDLEALTARTAVPLKITAELRSLVTEVGDSFPGAPRGVTRWNVRELWSQSYISPWASDFWHPAPSWPPDTWKGWHKGLEDINNYKPYQCLIAPVTNVTETGMAPGWRWRNHEYPWPLWIRGSTERQAEHNHGMIAAFEYGEYPRNYSFSAGNLFLGQYLRLSRLLDALNNMVRLLRGETRLTAEDSVRQPTDAPAGQPRRRVSQ